MERFIIVGGSGFVGQYALEALAKKYPNSEICILDVVEPKQNYGANFYFCDLTKEIDFVFSPSDIVIHLAARQYHPKPPREDRDWYFFELNYEGTKRLFEKMKESGCTRMIYFSTDMVYGLPTYIPLKSSHPKQPFGAYGKSKLASEEFLCQFWNQGFSITIFRPRMIVGKGRFGLLTKLFWLIKHNLPIPMIGNGENCYQMVSVEDCANAIVCAIQNGIPNICLNLGSKNPPKVKTLLGKLIRDTGSKSFLIPTYGCFVKLVLNILGKIGVELMYEEQYKIADVEYIVDISETTKAIGWEPQYCDEQMLRLAYEECNL